MSKGIEIDATQPALDESLEKHYREIIQAYAEIVASPDKRKLEDFGRGCVWGAYMMLDQMGYGEWAISTLHFELEDFIRKLKAESGGFFGYLQSRGTEARLNRLLIPGNSMQARVGG